MKFYPFQKMYLNKLNAATWNDKFYCDKKLSKKDFSKWKYDQEICVKHSSKIRLTPYAIIVKNCFLIVNKRSTFFSTLSTDSILIKTLHFLKYVFHIKNLKISIATNEYILSMKRFAAATDLWCRSHHENRSEN